MISLRPTNLQDPTTVADSARFAPREVVASESGPVVRSPDTVVLHTRVVTQRGGGPEKTILNSPRFLTGTGYRAICAFMHPPADSGFEVIRQRAAQLGAPLVSIADRGIWDARVIRRLLRVCRDERVTIWHAHDYKSNALGLLLRRFHPLRLVTTVHGWVELSKKLRLYYAIDRHCLRRYERVICVSDDLRQKCLRAGVSADRCLLVENAIDTDQCRRRLSRSDAKRQLGLSGQRLLIGACGRLSAEKGFDHLILAVDELLKRGMEVELAILGEGDEKKNLQQLVTRLGRQDRVHLPGHQSDLAPWYQAMDVFALSSLREGLPNVLLEALAWEVPAVATEVGGVGRLIEHGENGLLAPPGDVSQLAAAVGSLVSNPELRNRLAAQGRRTIEQRYSFARRMDKISGIYDQLLQASAT